MRAVVFASLLVAAGAAGGTAITLAVTARTQCAAQADNAAAYAAAAREALSSFAQPIPRPTL
jgi:hypothetical protein